METEDIVNKVSESNFPFFTTTKMSLKSVLINPLHNEIISKAVKYSHLIIMHAMDFLELYYIKCFDEGKEMPRLTKQLVLWWVFLGCQKRKR